MMTNKLKRGLSLMLALCMTLGLMTSGALADTVPESVQNEQSATVCAELDGCADGVHDADCPLYTAPEDEKPAEDEKVTALEAAAPLAEPARVHIATYVGQVPAALADKGVTADQFSTAYETVKVTVGDTEYTVEVVPQGLVYFIDSKDFTSTSTAPYDVVKALVGEGLLNDKYDQQSDGSVWGLTGGFKVKSTDNTNKEDKDYNGLYGSGEGGSSLVYVLPLSAGEYTITSLHREWWTDNKNPTRPMKATIQVGNGEAVDADSLTLNGNGDMKRIEAEFTVAEDSVVTYTVTSTGNNAPTISWLGVVKTGDVLPVGPTEVASGTCGTNVTWKLTNDGVLTISGNGKIDDKYAQNPAPWNAQGYTEQIKEVIIEEGITQIGSYAFYRCVNLKKVSLPSTLTNIGGYGSNTFAGCTALTSIEIPASVTTIKASSFAGCTALTSVNIPSGVTKIETSAFSGCAALTSITIPENVTEIGGSAFNGCTGLTSVTIPAKVKAVGDGAFQNCSKLSNVTFAEGSVLYTLHNTAFNGTAIKTLTIPSGIWNMNSGIYGNLPQLKAIIFEGVPSVTTANTFKNLDISQLTAYVYSAQDYNTLVATKAIATSQGGKPFGTYVLVNEGEIIDAGGSLVKDGYEFREWTPVEGCEGLVSAVWAEPAPEVIGGYCGKYTPGTDAQWTFDPATGVLSITGTGWTNEYYARNPAPWNEYKAQITEVVIGEGITSIGGYSFNKCVNLTKVTLPSTLERIGGYSDNTFSGCTALTSIVIPENVTNISGYAFSGCTGLTEVTIPGKVTTFGSAIFSGCTGLTKVTLTDGLKETPAFTNCTGLTELVVPDTVTKMGSLAGCSNLRSVNLPSGLKVLPILSGTAIETLVLPRNITLSDANGKLANCKDLTTIVGDLLYFNANQAKNLFKETDVSQITVYAYLYPDQEINNLLSRLSVDYMRDNAKGIYLVRPDETLTQSADGSYILTKDGFNFDGWEWIDTFGNVVEAGATNAKIQSAKWVCAHTWNDGEVTTEPTCTTAGVRTYTCTACGETRTESIDKLPHTPAEAFTSDEAGHWHLCTVCGEAGEKEAHVPEVIPAVAPDYGRTGLTEGSRCSVCGRILVEQEEVPALVYPYVPPVIDPPVDPGEVDIGDDDTPLARPFTYADVTEDSWYYDAVRYVFTQDVMDGQSDTAFAPGLAATRGTIVSLLYRLEDSPEAAPARFSDMAPEHPLAAAVGWASANGIALGYDDGRFAPDDCVTREQLAALLYRYAKVKGYDLTAKGDLSVFADGDRTPEWSLEAVRWAVGNGLLLGRDDGTLDLSAVASRAEVAQVILRMSRQFAPGTVA